MGGDLTFFKINFVLFISGLKVVFECRRPIVTNLSNTDCLKTLTAHA